jgi:hypothetical protein
MLTNYNFNPHPDPPEVFSSKPLPPWGETGKGVKGAFRKTKLWYSGYLK